MTTFSNIGRMSSLEENGDKDREHPEVTTPCSDGAVIEKMQIEEEVEYASECQQTIEIDSRLSWLVALSCSWVMFWSLLVNRSNSLIYLSLKQELYMSREESAAPFSMIGAVSNLFAIFSGLLIRRYPLFWTSIFGSLLTGIGVILAATIYNKFAITYCIGIITAIGQSLIFSTNMVAVNTYFQKYRSTASGVSYIGGSLVSFFLPFIYKELEKRFGFRFVLLLLGLLTLIACLGAIILLWKPVKATDNNNTSPGQSPAHTKKMDRRLPLIEQLAFMKRPIFYLIVVSGIVFAYVLVLFNITAVDFALEKKLSEHQSLLTLWFYAGGDLVGRLFSGQLSDHGWMKRRTVMALGFFLSSIAVFGLALTSHKILFFFLCSLYGLAAGSTIILFSVLIAEYLTLANLPMAIGVHCLINGIASLPRTRLIRYFANDADSYRSLYLFFAIISIVTCIAWSSHCLFMYISEDEAKKKTAEKQKTDAEDC